MYFKSTFYQGSCCFLNRRALQSIQVGTLMEMKVIFNVLIKRIAVNMDYNLRRALMLMDHMGSSANTYIQIHYY